MEKWELHEKPTLNTQSGFYMQSISSSESENMLACNAYGKDEKQVVERAELIVSVHEMLNALIHIEDFVTRTLTISGHSKKDIDFVLRKVRSIIKK